MLERLTQPGQLVEGDEGGAEGGEGEMDVLASLVANDEAAEAVEPGEGPFGDPAVAAELLAAVDAAPGDPRRDWTARATATSSAASRTW
jgi:hypothetical protein